MLSIGRMKYELIKEVDQPQTCYALATSPNGKWVATTNFDQKLRIYDAESLALLKVLHLGTSFPNPLAFSPDSAWVAAGGKSITLFSTSDWKKGLIFKGHKHEIQDAVFSPDGTRLYTGSGNNYTPADWSVRAWDTSSATELWRAKEQATVHAVAVSPDGTRVAMGNARGHVAVFDAASGEALWRGAADGWVYGLAFSVSGSELLASGDGAALAVLDAASGATQRTLRMGGGARRFAQSKDGRTLVYGRIEHGGGGGLDVVDLATGSIAWTSGALGYMPRGLVISPDERRIYALMLDPNRLVVYQRSE